MNKTIIALALTLSFVAPAYAQRFIQGTIAGYEANVQESGSMIQPDYIEVWGPNGVENIEVTCGTERWESYGANTAQWAEMIATEWCRG